MDDIDTHNTTLNDNTDDPFTPLIVLIPFTIMGLKWLFSGMCSPQPESIREPLYNHTETVLKKVNYIVNTNDIECSICFEDFIEDEELVILDCNHLFHAKCISHWVIKKHSCPLCRSYIV